MSSRKPIDNGDILAALIRNKGNVTAASRDLKITSCALRERIKKNQIINEKYEEYKDEIVDIAIGALKKNLESDNPNPVLLMYVLDRLGRDRGFEKPSVRHVVAGDPANPVGIEHTQKFDLSGLSMNEKLLIMKVAKKKKEEKGEIPANDDEIVDVVSRVMEEGEGEDE